MRSRYSGLIRSVKDEDNADKTGEVSEKYFQEEIVFHIFQFIVVHLIQQKV